ncbi:probable serine/threonine-protein kinase kinX [Aethina tumida]|uniref:probable serine/threonine-protein kinase kinX n=1 Tax=Aethina tumida TaxID=116153 RepID=UPI002147448F|nr:probable serine/threonine-protein kinase kinX [Aethina tumida]
MGLLTGFKAKFKSGRQEKKHHQDVVCLTYKTFSFDGPPVAYHVLDVGPSKTQTKVSERKSLSSSFLKNKNNPNKGPTFQFVTSATAPLSSTSTFETKVERQVNNVEEKVSVERKITIKSDNNVEDDYERFEIHNPLPAIDNLSENDFKVHKSHTSITNSNHKQEIDVGNFKKDVDSSTSSDIEDDDDDDDEENFKITIVSPTKNTSTSEVNISSDDFVNTQASSHINIYENINEDSDDEDHKNEEIQEDDDGNFKIHFVQHSQYAKNDKNGNGSKKINFVEPIHNEMEEEETQDEEDEGNFKINVVQHPPSKTVDNFDNSDEDEEDDGNFKIQIVQKTNNKKDESEKSEEEDKLEKYTSQGYSNQAASIFLDSDDEYEPQVMRPRHFHEDEEDC